ncbi:uncharacterized protein LOC129351347 [Poeciliopsis prolifica]|uniref:uncharacterized protein LOC129351347 n=1 Tax=Poeciliopsis prolifica TaxID=188132 RepID=UPI002414414D|nr:uncharacterized protein LOC129351347 [Poeciliopsis prolifica]
MARLALFLLLVWTGSQLAGALVFEIHIRAIEGRPVTLPCRAPDVAGPIKYLEWSRTDQKMSYIILYQDQHFHPDFQDRAFRERAELLDKEMKEGQVSLVLRNTSAADSGVYECRVVQALGTRQKRSVLNAEPDMVIKLRVSPERQIPDAAAADRADPQEVPGRRRRRPAVPGLPAAGRRRGGSSAGRDHMQVLQVLSDEELQTRLQVTQRRTTRRKCC